MQRAFLGGLLVGLVCPVLGVFLVLRRLSLMADTLSHVALAGVALGLLTKVFPTLTALLASVTAAVLIDRLRASGKMYGEAALALFLYTALGLAVVFIGLAGGFNVDLFSYLFGNVLTVSETDIWLLGALALALVAFVLLFYTELVQTTFDPDLARVNGVPVDLVDFLLAVLAGATVTLAMRVVGILLVGALMVIPVLASLQVARGFRTTIVIAAAIGLFAVIAGLFAAYYRNVPASGVITLITLAALLGTTLVKSVWGPRSAGRRLANSTAASTDAPGDS